MARWTRGMAFWVLSVAALAASAAKEPLSHTESATVTATIESVDPETRSVVLRDESGERMMVVAGPEVRNFSQVHAGDHVSVTYLIGVAARVKPRGTPASAPTESTVTERATAGQKPGVLLGQDISATVRIDAVDTSFNTVTFTRADGITRVVSVESPDAQKFIRTLKPGDSVELTYSEATAIGVTPADAK